MIAELEIYGNRLDFGSRFGFSPQSGGTFRIFPRIRAALSEKFVNRGVW